jgi:uncharacterized YccA/Bax inhibitor family protein
MRSGNPALTADTFQKVRPYDDVDSVMTLQGTVNKSAILLFLVFIASGWTWHLYYQAPDPNPAVVYPWMIAGIVGGLIFAFITIFKMEWAPITAPIYALLEGLAIGGLSAIAEAKFPGIVLQAVGLTFGTLLALLAAYTSRLVKPTENFKLGIVAATGGIFLVYLATFILGFFGVAVPYIHGNGLIGIGFSVFVVIIAALNLVLDFDFIEGGVNKGAPKYMEWYGAFGLMVTLIWLYIEILRLLMKIRGRD